MYGPHPPPHSTHGLVNGRSSLHHSVAYPHVDSYSSPYLFGPTAYSPPAPTRPGLSPHSPIGTITVGTASQNSTNSSISAQSVLQSKSKVKHELRNQNVNRIDSQTFFSTHL